MPDWLRRIPAFWKLTREELRRDNAMMFAAGVAFYATFSLAPLLLLLLRGGAVLFGHQAARNRLLGFMEDAAGASVAAAAGRVLRAASQADNGATAASAILLVIAASAVFRHLKAALNVVLDVPTREDGGFLRYLRNRAAAAVMAVTGIMVVTGALAATAVLAWIRAHAPGTFGRLELVWRGAELLVSFAVLTIVFTAVLKFVPDIRMKWRHAGTGGALAALVFATGQFLIGVYVSRTRFTAAYGAAGSVVLLLLYVYFTVAVILAAAELMEVVARGDRDFREERRRLQDGRRYRRRKSDERVSMQEHPGRARQSEDVDNLSDHSDKW